MKKDKNFLEYQEKFNNIPNDYIERFIYILKNNNYKDKDLKNIQKALTDLGSQMWNRLDFIFYMFPEATPRPRLSSRSGKFYVKNAYRNSELFKEFLKENNLDNKMIITPCKFYCDTYMKIPSGMNKCEKILSELKLIRPISNPDWDNLGKTYSDMVQNSLILVDSLIIDGMVRKFYSFKPRIEITIEYSSFHDCKFNKKKVENWDQYKSNIEKIDQVDNII